MSLPLLAYIDRTYQVSNYIEAGLWITMGIGCLLLACFAGRRRPIRLLPLAAAGVLIVFGCSDIVEAHTGAWWDPWWLLVWKVLCVGLLVLLLILAKVWRKAPPSPEATKTADEK